MLTQIHNRATTNDIDILLKDIENEMTSPRYLIFKTAMRTVALRNNIPGAWVNDVMGDFHLDETLDDIFP